MVVDAYREEVESEEACAQDMVEDNGLFSDGPELLRKYFVLRPTCITSLAEA